MQEIKELKRDRSPEFLAEALEEDIFEWHFVVRGPPDSVFEGGIYHGRILLPAEYPFKPPSFMMLTPNGRFQTGVKICLSISSHHPEHWQPSWSVRTAIVALMAFMPSPGQGALGSLDFSDDERRKLARQSRTNIPKFGDATRQLVIDSAHKRMLEVEEKEGPLTSRLALPADMQAMVQASSQQQAPAASATAAAPSPPVTELSLGTSPRPEGSAGISPGSTMQQPAPSAAPVAMPQHPQQLQPQQRQLQAQPPQPQHLQAQLQAQLQQQRVTLPQGEGGLMLLAAAVVVAIAAILLRKVLLAMRNMPLAA